MTEKLSRRGFFKGGLAAFFGAVGVTGLMGAEKLDVPGQISLIPMTHQEDSHNSMGMVGTVDHQLNGFDPLQMLVDWDYGKVSTLLNGQTLREYEFIALDREIEIAPGILSCMDL